MFFGITEISKVWEFSTVCAPSLRLSKLLVVLTCVVLVLEIQVLQRNSHTLHTAISDQREVTLNPEVLLFTSP